MDSEQEIARGVAGDVGDAYLGTRGVARASLVKAAYESLQGATDRMFGALSNKRNHDAVRIVFTRCPEPYRSDYELIAAVKATRILEVSTAAIHAVRIHPLLGCELGGPFDRFRAVHDLLGHVATGLGFELADELAVWRWQDRQYGGLARWALATEILGVNSARSVLGEAPEQKAILLDRALVARARASVAVPGPARVAASGPLEETPTPNHITAGQRTKSG